MTKYCPQHGYPLPCHKCNEGYDTTSYLEGYAVGKKVGIGKVVEWVEEHTHNIEEWTGWQEQKEDWGL